MLYPERGKEINPILKPVGARQVEIDWIRGVGSHLARADALMAIADGMLTATRPPGKK